MTLDRRSWLSAAAVTAIAGALPRRRLNEIQPQLDAALKFGFLSRAVSASELIWH